MAAATPLCTVPTITSTSSLSISLRTLLTPTLGSAVSSSLMIVYFRPAISGPASLAPSVKPANVLSPSTVNALENGSSTPILIGSAARATDGASVAPRPAAVVLRKRRRFIVSSSAGSGDPEIALLDVAVLAQRLRAAGEL